MKQSYRILYYLIGFLVGSGIVYYIWAAKNTTFDYGPNARVLKDLRIKKKIYTPDVLRSLAFFTLDTSAISVLFSEGNVDFSKSDTKKEPCKEYYINGEVSNRKQIAIRVKNCDSTATIIDLEVE